MQMAAVGSGAKPGPQTGLPSNDGRVHRRGAASAAMSSGRLRDVLALVGALSFVLLALAAGPGQCGNLHPTLAAPAETFWKRSGYVVPHNDPDGSVDITGGITFTSYAEYEIPVPDPGSGHFTRLRFRLEGLNLAINGVYLKAKDASTGTWVTIGSNFAPSTRQWSTWRNVPETYLEDSLGGTHSLLRIRVETVGGWDGLRVCL